MSPSIFRERGYRFYFLSDEEDRIHIHVKYDDVEDKFWIELKAPLAVVAWTESKKIKRNSKNRGGA